MNPSFNFNSEREFKSQLEQLIDSKGMSYVLECIIEVCDEKSQHCAENWQDEKLAKQWYKTASKIDKFTAKIEGTTPL